LADFGEPNDVGGWLACGPFALRDESAVDQCGGRGDYVALANPCGCGDLAGACADRQLTFAESFGGQEGEDAKLGFLEGGRQGGKLEPGGGLGYYR
jgi:hypothetical protein